MSSMDLKRYFGSLNTQQIIDGMNACLENAKSLVNDAEILYRQGKYPRAFCLCILVFEELGKIPMLSRTLLFDPQDLTSWKNFWKRFRKHEAKQFNTAFLEPFLINGSVKTAVQEVKAQRLTEALKQLGFYVDFIELDGPQLMTPLMAFPVNQSVEETLKLAKNRIKLISTIQEIITTQLEQLKINGLLEKKLEELKNLAELLLRATKEEI